jgi:hypothetical protein
MLAEDETQKRSGNCENAMDYAVSQLTDAVYRLIEGPGL